MSPDLLDRIADFASQLLPAGIWILVALFGFLASMRDKAKTRKQGGQVEPSQQSRPRPQSRPATPSPSAPAPPSGPSYGTPYTEPSPERQRATREEAKPTYGSHDKAVWGSVFDDPGEEPRWGFDESEWGSSFGPKKNAEPTISQG